MRALSRKLLRDLWRARGQAVTIALVVACGMGGFIASLSTHDSLARSRDRFYEASHFAQVFADLKRAPAALRDRISALPGVAQVETRVVHDVQLDLAGVDQPVTSRMIGIEAGTPGGMGRLVLRRGQWLAPGSGAQALVSERFAEARGLAPGDRVHALLNGRRTELAIVGVVLSPEYIYATRGGALPDDEWFGVMWIERRRLAAAFDMEGAFNSVQLRLAPGASERVVVHALDRVLAPWGGRGAYGRADQTSHKIVEQEIQQQRVMGTVLPAVFLAVAVYILNVVLHRQVATQREQIAALKALGYEDRWILAHYLQFSLLIVLAGVVAGLGLGVWLGHYMTRMYTAFFHFPEFRHETLPWVVIASGGIAVVAAAAGTLQAIRGVVRLSPAEAMRAPSPAAYRPTLIERAGMSAFLTPASRMILRNLERRPLRSVLAALGVAASVAILVSGTFWGDAVDRFIEIQFDLAQPAGIQLGFVEPVGREALHELSRLPGVLRVETGRMLAVRLSFGHRGERASLSGLVGGARLQRPIDQHLGEVPLPPAGLLLDRRLAERLGVVPGDALRVEVMEGARPVRRVVVGGLVDGLVGSIAYLGLDALNRLAGEGRTVSSASIAVDPAGREALLERLKALPKVGQVIVRDSLLATFRQTSARNMLFFAGVLTVFAAVIAVGVVYNSARIALAERAWELASLRVLGFTRGEVSRIFLGELAVVMGVGVPLGCWAGYGLGWLIVFLTRSDAYQIPFVILPSTYGYAVVTVLAAGVASAFIVRHRIDRLDLVAVLKTRE